MKVLVRDKNNVMFYMSNSESSKMETTLKEYEVILIVLLHLHHFGVVTTHFVGFLITLNSRALLIPIIS